MFMKETKESVIGRICIQCGLEFSRTNPCWTHKGQYDALSADLLSMRMFVYRDGVCALCVAEGGDVAAAGFLLLAAETAPVTDEADGAADEEME